MKRVTARRTKTEKQMIFKQRDSGGDMSGEEKGDGDRKGNRTERVRGVERMTHPTVESTYLLSSSSSSLALSLFLEPRLSAPGSHTCGASHPIITLKWLLPHQ